MFWYKSRKNQNYFNNWPPSYRGSFKITVVCPSFYSMFAHYIHPPVQHFSQECHINVLWFFPRWKIIGIFKKWQNPFFQENSFLPKFGQKNRPKWPQNRVFWFFWKILSLVFLRNNLEWKLILLLIFQHQSHIRQNSWSSVLGRDAVSQ